MSTSINKSRHAIRTVAIAVSLAVGLASCSAAARTPTSYNASVERNFVAGCEGTGKADGITNTRSFCTCAYGELRKSLPFSQFKRVNTHLTDRGGRLPSEVTALVDRCTK